MRRMGGRGLSSGTVAERIAPESLTPTNSGFVHRNISRWRFRDGTRSSFERADKPGFVGGILKVLSGPESNQKRGRVKPRVAPFTLSPCGRGWLREAKPGEGFLSTDANPSSVADFVRATFSHKGRREEASPLNYLNSSSQPAPW